MTQVVVTQTITSATTPAQFLAENAARAEYSLNNSSTAILYVLHGPGIPSSTNYTYQIVGSATNTLATPWVELRFKGRVSGVWASANGSAIVAETFRDDSHS